MPDPKLPTLSGSDNPIRGAAEVLPDRLYFCALARPPPGPLVRLTLRHSKHKVPVHMLNVDDELVYWNFFRDFGPLNLGQLRRFCTRLESLLRRRAAVVCLWSSSADPAKRANAMYLLGAWQVLHLRRTPAEAARCLSEAPRPHTTIARQTVAPPPPFRDASPYECAYRLTLSHCLEGLEKAMHFNFFGDWETFDVEEYEHFEQVENGDLNWIIYGKILAFAGPSYRKNVSPEGYCTLAPSDYIPYFREKNVGLVVRLNQKNYEEQEFIDAGIRHFEQYYLDGSCPPMSILNRVLEELEAVPRDRAFAMHCKAGLGRTGTCIGAYLIKHYGFTAAQAIAWMRICRPGCVIGPQQQFLQRLEPTLLEAGERMRRGTKEDDGPTSPTAEVDVPMSPTADIPEAETGRVGQAAGLLSRRARQTGTTAVAPVTPDVSMTTS